VGGWGSEDDEPDERTLREAGNGRAQAVRVSALVREGLSLGSSFRLTPELVLELHGIAMDGLLASAGRLRARSDGEILGSRHVMPTHDRVPELLVEACDFVNARPEGDRSSSPPTFSGGFAGSIPSKMETGERPEQSRTSSCACA
jgi:hypothetical protein